MLEEDESILPVFLLAHTLNPGLEFRIAIIGSPETHVPPLGCSDKRNVEVVLCFGPAERDMILSKQAKDLVLEPGLVAKLDRRATVGGQQREKLLQPR